jgi:hypothetical protein
MVKVGRKGRRRRRIRGLWGCPKNMTRGMKIKAQGRAGKEEEGAVAADVPLQSCIASLISSPACWVLATTHRSGTCTTAGRWQCRPMAVSD